MYSRLTQLRDSLRQWSLHHVEGPHAGKWLSALSFTESSFFPVPTDVLLIAILIVRGKEWIRYAWLATIFSVLGGVLGYFLGAVLFDLVGQTIIDIYNLQVKMDIVSVKFESNAFLAIFLAAFTPIPYKVFTIAAGLFHINFVLFVVASLFGRGLRFFTLAYLLNRYGKRIGSVVYRYFNALTFVVLIVVLIVVLLFTFF